MPLPNKSLHQNEAFDMGSLFCLCSARTFLTLLKIFSKTIETNYYLAAGISDLSHLYNPACVLRL
jgi:hypothetical protein